MIDPRLHLAARAGLRFYEQCGRRAYQYSVECREAGWLESARIQQKVAEYWYAEARDLRTLLIEEEEST